MPAKYHITTQPVPNRFAPVIRSGVIAWEEGCLKCVRCVKKECVYKVYEKRALDPRQMIDSLDSICKDCFRCVQNCPNRLIEKGFNPSYKALGDDYWTPDILSNVWFQAETGRIPVSGAGYGGPFSGPGFDSMWTDMSEIVRPTRDGIHGREYISTTVDLGRKVKFLNFEKGDGYVPSSIPPLVELPLPAIFDLLPFSPPGRLIQQAILGAARSVKTLAVVRASEWQGDYMPYLNETLLYLDEIRPEVEALLGAARLVEIPDGADVPSRRTALKAKNPGLVVAIRLPVGEHSARRAADLVQEGAEVIHLVADAHGVDGQGRFIKDRMKEIHLHLVEKGIRDLVTLIGGGGVAMAEHMAKLIICGADAVSCDIALLIAMECHVCKRCTAGIPCPVALDLVNPGWGAARIRNLVAGWHNQLIEILGAMGIREVRRLRGEMGRAMFYEELEKEFATLGKRG
ncbi:MAG: glutamate synthase-related protein [Syntrophorhabdales bacterium]|jgi:ferredoxin